MDGHTKFSRDFDSINKEANIDNDVLFLFYLSAILLNPTLAQVPANCFTNQQTDQSEFYSFKNDATQNTGT